MWPSFICEWQVGQFFLFVQCNQVVKAKLRGPLFAGHGQVLSASVWIIFIAKDFNQKTHSWETRTWASFMCLDLNHLHCKMQPVLVHIHLFTLIEDIFDKVGKSRTWAFKFQVSSFKFQVPQSESSSLPSAAFTVAFLLQLKYPRSANFNFFQTIYQLHFKHAMLAGTISKTNINSSIPCLKI